MCVHLSKLCTMVYQATFCEPSTLPADKMSTRISIDQIFGASINDNSSCSLQDNILAYTASGGVVVCTVAGTKIENQRFFCANSINRPNSKYELGAQQALENDALGFPKLSNPIRIGPDNLHSEDQDCDPPKHTSSTNSLSSSKLKDKIRTITCVALAPNKKLLAVGESGFQPRILIYSLAADSNEYPLACISEHTFGVNSLSFSGDSRYLVSLGVSTDATLNIWKLSKSKSQFNVFLFGSNKCTSIVNNVIWEHNFLFTFGLRHIKLWKPDDRESTFKNLNIVKGKAVLLGNLLNENFTHGYVHKHGYFITDSGIFCKVDLGRDTLILVPLYKFDANSTFHIDAKSDRLWYENGGKLCYKIFSEINDSSFSPHVSKRNLLLGMISLGESVQTNRPKKGVLSIQPSGENALIYISYSQISVFDIASETSAKLIESVYSHACGIKSSNNKVIYWSEFGEIGEVIADKKYKVKHIKSAKLLSGSSIDNKLTAVDVTGDDDLILGDRLGFFQIQNRVGKTLYQGKIHESSINDIGQLTVGNFQFIITVSRDRYVQVLYKKKSEINDKENDQETAEVETDTNPIEWELLRTLELHKASINQVKTFNNRIYVCSADRLISVHEIDVTSQKDPKINCVKVIGLKSTPIQMNIYGNELLVSCNDKQIQIFDLGTFKPTRTFKFTNESGNSLLAEHFVVIPDLDIIVCSCSDKSFRSFTYSSGLPLTTNWGHAGLVVGMELARKNNGRCEILTISNDGCLFLWNLHSEKAPVSEDPVTTTSENLVLSKVQRKIIKSDTNTLPIQKKKAFIRSLINSPAASIQSRTSLPISRSVSMSRNQLSRSVLVSSSRNLSDKPLQNHRNSASVSLDKSSVHDTLARSNSLKLSRKQPVAKPVNGMIDDLILSLQTIRSVHKTRRISPEKMQTIQKELILTQKAFQSSQDTTTKLLENYSEELIKIIQQKMVINETSQ